jgi:hypothetical protein
MGAENREGADAQIEPQAIGQKWRCLKKWQVKVQILEETIQTEGASRFSTF